jgi:hypothetical protein
MPWDLARMIDYERCMMRSGRPNSVVMQWWSSWCDERGRLASLFAQMYGDAPTPTPHNLFLLAEFEQRLVADVEDTACVKRVALESWTEYTLAAFDSQDTVVQLAFVWKAARKSRILDILISKSLDTKKLKEEVTSHEDEVKSLREEVRSLKEVVESLEEEVKSLKINAAL